MMKLLKPLNSSSLLNDGFVRKIIINKPHKATILIFDWEKITAESYEAHFSTLATKEKARAKNISHLKRKREYILARSLTRMSLSWFCKSEQQPNHAFLAPKDWDIQENEFGKPFIANNLLVNINFNISHTDKYLAIAITKEDEIGIDLEPVRSSPLSPFPTHLFSRAELKALKKLDDVNHSVQFAQLWTAKEAAAKCVGKGMNIDFSKIELMTAETGKMKVVSKNSKINDISLHSLPLNDDRNSHQLSIAFMTKAKSLMFSKYPITQYLFP